MNATREVLRKLRTYQVELEAIGVAQKSARLMNMSAAMAHELTLIAKVEALGQKEEGSAGSDLSPASRSHTPLSAGLTEPYRPAAIHHEAADVLEFVQRDVPTFAKPVQAGLDVLLTVDQREPIGWRIYGWSRIAPPAEGAPSGAQRSELTPQAPDSPKSNEAEQ